MSAYAPDESRYAAPVVEKFSPHLSHFDTTITFEEMQANFPEGYMISGKRDG